ncbi:unnamed protein product, partial [Mesorhabditis spiculigera]
MTLYARIISLLLLVVVVFGCKIEMNVRNAAKAPVEVVFQFSNETKYRFMLTGENDQENFMMEHERCAAKPTWMRGQKKGDTFAFLDGTGMLRYVVQDFLLLPRMVSRMGTFCSFGDCGYRG